MNKRNIGIFLQDLNSGGAEKIMVGFMNYLCENTDDNVNLILVRRVGPYFKELDPRIKVTYLDAGKTLYSFFALYKALRKLEIDFLYTTLVNTNILALFVGKIFGFKIIIREANTIEEDRKKESRPLIKVAQYLSDYLYKWCYKCIAISNNVRDDLIKYTNCPSEKIHVIYNPLLIVDHLDVVPDTSSFNVCMVSRITAQKNIGTIANIIDILLSKGLNVRFHFFGEGDCTDLNLVIEKYKGSDKIIMHGFERSYYSYLKHMDLFIHIPIWEGFGNSVLEAYNSGIPMILSDINSGYSELIDKNAEGVYYVDKFDTDRICHLIENQIISKGKRGRRERLMIDKNDIYEEYRKLAN